MINVGKRIKDLRKQFDFSGKELAASMGVSQAFLSALESNSKKCSLENLDKICTAFGISLGDFFAEKPSKIPPELFLLTKKYNSLSDDQLNALNALIKLF